MKVGLYLLTSKYLYYESNNIINAEIPTEKTYTKLEVKELLIEGMLISGTYQGDIISFINGINKWI